MVQAGAMRCGGYRLFSEASYRIGFVLWGDVSVVADEIGFLVAVQPGLRIQHCRKPFRVLYEFDPRRCGILLVGGDKTGQDRWYDEHLETLKKEGYDNG